MTLYAVSVSVNFLVSLSLLLGVKMEKKWLLLPWIVWTALNLVISQAVVLYAPDRTTSTIPDIFSTAIMVYCMLCVISYYQTLSRPSLSESTPSSTAAAPPPFPASLSPGSHCASFPACNPPSSDWTPDLTVALPPSPPPAYPADTPPLYDPPPPYPGYLSPEEKSLVVRCENETAGDDDEVPPAPPAAPASLASPTSTVSPTTPSPLAAGPLPSPLAAGPLPLDAPGNLAAPMLPSVAVATPDTTPPNDSATSKI